MEIVNGKIKRCSEVELFQIWILQWSDLLDFETYKRRCIRKGVIVDEWREECVKENGAYRSDYESD